MTGQGHTFSAASELAFKHQLIRAQGPELPPAADGPAMPSYESLFGTDSSPVKRGTIPPEDRRKITERLKAFASSPRMKDDALALYVNAQARSDFHEKAARYVRRSHLPVSRCIWLCLAAPLHVNSTRTTA